jgi:hypothetical protein
MTDTPKTTLLDLDADPILRFLADGGSWADAIEMDYEQNLIPLWTSQLKGCSPKKRSPSALKHRQRLIDNLQSAYAYCGVSGDRFQAILNSILTP